MCCLVGGPAGAEQGYAAAQCEEAYTLHGALSVTLGSTERGREGGGGDVGRRGAGKEAWWQACGTPLTGLWYVSL